MSGWVKVLLAGVGGLGFGLFAGYAVGHRKGLEQGSEGALYDDGYSAGWNDSLGVLTEGIDLEEFSKTGVIKFIDDYPLRSLLKRKTAGVDKYLKKEDRIRKEIADYAGEEEQDPPEMEEIVKGVTDPGDTDGDEDYANLGKAVNNIVKTVNEIVGDIRQFHPEDFKPVPITEEEFSFNPNEREIKLLNYYAIDEVTYDPDEEEIIKDPEGLLGIAFWAGFFGDPNNPVTDLYIDNETMGTMYQVHLIDAAFCDVVDGQCAPEDE